MWYKGLGIKTCGYFSLVLCTHAVPTKAFKPVLASVIALYRQWLFISSFIQSVFLRQARRAVDQYVHAGGVLSLMSHAQVPPPEIRVSIYLSSWIHVNDDEWIADGCKYIRVSLYMTNHLRLPPPPPQHHHHPPPTTHPIIYIYKYKAISPNGVSNMVQDFRTQVYCELTLSNTFAKQLSIYFGIQYLPLNFKSWSACDGTKKPIHKLIIKWTLYHDTKLAVWWAPLTTKQRCWSSGERQIVHSVQRGQNVIACSFYIVTVMVCTKCVQKGHCVNGLGTTKMSFHYISMWNK